MNNLKKLSVICDDILGTVDSIHDSLEAASKFIDVNPSKFDPAFCFQPCNIYVPQNTVCKDVVDVDHNLFLKETDKFSMSTWRESFNGKLYYVQPNSIMKPVEFTTKKEISIDGYSCIRFFDKYAYVKTEKNIYQVESELKSRFYLEIGNFLYGVVFIAKEEEMVERTRGEDENLTVCGWDNHYSHYLIEKIAAISNSVELPVEPLDSLSDKAKLEQATKLLKLIMDCPKYADEASRAVPFDEDNQAHRAQLVMNISCSYEKVHQLKQFLGEGTCKQ